LETSLSTPQPTPAPQTPPSTASSAPPAPGVIFVTSGELFWLTISIWIGGIFILTLMPVLLIPRIGMLPGIIGSYLLFFSVWQPVQTITQRTFGVRTGLIRMILFVAAAASIAFYLREALLGMARG
jgi:hypothetical protein